MYPAISRGAKMGSPDTDAVTNPATHVVSLVELDNAGNAVWNGDGRSQE